MYYVYVLVNEVGETYTGFSSDLTRRMAEHLRGDGYTCRKGRWRPCYYEAFASEDDARNRERALKKSSQSRRWLRKRIAHSMKLCRKS